MAAVLVVGSEEQLRCGINWLRRIAEHMSLDSHILVIGDDSNVLMAQAEKAAENSVNRSADNGQKKPSVTMVPAAIDDMLEWLRVSDASVLLMIHSMDSRDLQQVLFERSHAQALWLRTSDDPPDSSKHIFQAVQNPVPLSTLACEKMLGLIPHQVMLPVTEDGDQLREDILAEIEQSKLDADDFVWFGVANPHRSDPIYSTALALLKSSAPASLALVREGETMSQSLGARIHRWASTVAPPMQREERIELASSLEMGSKPNLEFLGLMSASSMLAAFGLLQDSAAVIIGAMLIAPLMTPILGAGLSLAHGNKPLFRSALLTITIGFLGALVSSILFGWLVTLFQQPEVTPEMWARCRPSPLDFCVGMVGGIAAAYARTRNHLSSALAGAAIAAALVPPISTAGLQIAFGHWSSNEDGVAITGPLLLVSINVLTIMIGSSFILWARGMRSDDRVPLQDRWGLRMMMLLMILAAIVLTRVVDAETIFPSGQ